MAAVLANKGGKRRRRTNPLKRSRRSISSKLPINSSVGTLPPAQCVSAGSAMHDLPYYVGLKEPRHDAANQRADREDPRSRKRTRCRTRQAPRRSAHRPRARPHRLRGRAAAAPSRIAPEAVALSVRRQPAGGADRAGHLCRHRSLPAARPVRQPLSGRLLSDLRHRQDQARRLSRVRPPPSRLSQRAGKAQLRLLFLRQRHRRLHARNRGAHRAVLVPDQACAPHHRHPCALRAVRRLRRRRELSGAARRAAHGSGQGRRTTRRAQAREWRCRIVRDSDRLSGNDRGKRNGLQALQRAAIDLQPAGSLCVQRQKNCLSTR